MEILFGIVFTIFMVYFAEEISDFRLLWACSCHGNSCLFSENFQLVSQGFIKPFRCPTSYYRGGARGVVQEREGKRCEGEGCGGRSVVFSRDRNKHCQD